MLLHRYRVCGLDIACPALKLVRFVSVLLTACVPGLTAVNHKTNQLANGLVIVYRRRRVYIVDISISMHLARTGLKRSA